jgi:hypothetical protein
MMKIPKGPFYEYKIHFKPEVKIKRVRRRLLQLLEVTPQFAKYKNLVAHDGSEKLIAAKKLPAANDGPLDVSVQLYDEDEAVPDDKAKTFLISLSFVGEINNSNVNE